MFITSFFVAAAAAASKWLIAAEIMSTVGTCCLTIAPAVEAIKNESKKGGVKK